MSTNIYPYFRLHQDNAELSQEQIKHDFNFDNFSGITQVSAV